LSEALRKDIEETISGDDIPWRTLRGGTVLVTGATGLVGGLLVRALSAANGEYGLNLRVIAHGGNGDKGKALLAACGDGTAFVRGDVRESASFDGIAGGVDYAFHCAAITRSADMVARPADVIETELLGAMNALALARERRCKAFVYLSSMEVYGQTELAEVREGDLGHLDLSKPRSCYPEGKRMCELLCVSYAAQYGLPVKIARLARTFGAGVPNDANDMRVASRFARSALAGEDIELHTQGKSIANCCCTVDAVRGLLTVLTRGAAGEAYNVANPAASVTIREMAELVANEVCDGAIKVVVDVPQDIQKYGYAPDVGHRLNADKLKALGWTPEYGLAEMYRRMLADWREGRTTDAWADAVRK
jgi:nucleoside-diphosphate-sugar epimerase